MIDGAANGRALALAATLGKKLLVVDLDRDHARARNRRARGARVGRLGHRIARLERVRVVTGGRVPSRAPGCVELELERSRVDPCLDPNLCVVGGANGESAHVRRRATQNALARWRRRHRGGARTPDRSTRVIRFARHDGGGLLYGTCAGVRAFTPRSRRSSSPTENETENVFEDITRRVSAPDADAAGVVVRVPGVDACGASRAFAPGARVVVATAREAPRGAGRGGRRRVRETRGTRVGPPPSREGEGEGVVSNASFVETTHSGKKSVWSSTRPFPWWAGPDAMHARARDVPRRDHRAAPRGARGSDRVRVLVRLSRRQRFSRTGEPPRAKERRRSDGRGVRRAVPRSRTRRRGARRGRARLVRRRAGKRRGARVARGGRDDRLLVGLERVLRCKAMLGARDSRAHAVFAKRTFNERATRFTTDGTT